LNITNHSETLSSYVPEFIKGDKTEKVTEQSTTLYNVSGVYTQHSITRWVVLIRVTNFKFYSTPSRANWHFYLRISKFRYERLYSKRSGIIL